MPVSRDEFMLVVESSRSLAEAAAKLGVRWQSVEARLNRIRTKRSDKSDRKKMADMSARSLESAWNRALDDGDLALADDLFGEMCRRLER